MFSSGLSRTRSDVEVIRFPDRPGSFWVVESTFVGALEVSLSVPDPGSVAAFHAASLAAGGRSLAEPGVQSEHNDGYYAARIADFDGNSIEVVARVAVEAPAVAA